MSYERILPVCSPLPSFDRHKNDHKGLADLFNAKVLKSQKIIFGGKKS